MMAQPTSNRRLDIQGLRAVAVLMVLVFHANLPFPGGFSGVDVFFVVSGYVITAMLEREVATHGTIRMPRFYIRRFKRLTPALAITVLVTIVAAFFLQSPLGTQQRTAATGMGAVLLSANVVIQTTTGGYFDLAAGSNALLHTWSLAVEEQFYLAFPLILLLSWRVARTRGQGKLPIMIVAVVSAVSLGLALLGSSSLPAVGGVAWIGFYSPLSRAWEFGVGSLLTLTSFGASWSPRVHAVVGLLGLALLGASMVALTEQQPYPGVVTLLPVLGTALLLVSGNSARTITARLLSLRPVVLVGDWSYSLYLWHWPFVVFAGALWGGSRRVAVIATLASVLPSLLSYYGVEEPIRRLAIARRRALAGLVAAVVLPPLVVSASLWWGAQQGFGNPVIQRYQREVLASHLGVETGCHLDGPGGPKPFDACTHGGAATGRPIYLVGDSNADHFVEGVVAAGEVLGRPVVTSTASACAFAEIPWAGAGIVPDCARYVTETLDRLEGAEAGTVIISNGDSYWNDPGWAVDASNGVLRDSASKLNAYGRSLESTVRRLQAAGHRVVLVQATPTWDPVQHPWAPSECTTSAITRGGCEQSMPESDAVSSQGPTRAVVALVGSATASSVVDVWPQLCSAGVCSTVTDGHVRYINRDHITVWQSHQLSHVWVSALGVG